MASRILAARDAVRAFLVTELEPARPDQVQAAYIPVLDRADFTGWRAWVYPSAYRDSARLARNRVRKELRVTVEFEVKYDEPASAEPTGRVPVTWVDQQVEYVETRVFDPLNETAVGATELLAGRFRNESCAVNAVFDPVRLHEDKVFASLIEIVLSEPAEG